MNLEQKRAGEGNYLILLINTLRVCQFLELYMLGAETKQQGQGSEKYIETWTTTQNNKKTLPSEPN